MEKITARKNTDRPKSQQVSSYSHKLSQINHLVIHRKPKLKELPKMIKYLVFFFENKLGNLFSGKAEKEKGSDGQILHNLTRFN